MEQNLQPKKKFKKSILILIIVATFLTAFFSVTATLYIVNTTTDSDGPIGTNRNITNSDQRQSWTNGSNDEMAFIDTNQGSMGGRGNSTFISGYFDYLGNVLDKITLGVFSRIEVDSLNATSVNSTSYIGNITSATLDKGKFLYNYSIGGTYNSTYNKWSYNQSDNLGNHIATQNLQMSGYGINNVWWLAHDDDMWLNVYTTGTGCNGWQCSDASSADECGPTWGCVFDCSGDVEAYCVGLSSGILTDSDCLASGACGTYTPWGAGEGGYCDNPACDNYNDCINVCGGIWYGGNCSGALGDCATDPVFCNFHQPPCTYNGCSSPSGSYQECPTQATFTDCSNAVTPFGNTCTWDAFTANLYLNASSTIATGDFNATGFSQFNKTQIGSPDATGLAEDASLTIGSTSDTSTTNPLAISCSDANQCNLAWNDASGNQGKCGIEGGTGTGFCRSTSGNWRIEDMAGALATLTASAIVSTTGTFTTLTTTNFNTASMKNTNLTGPVNYFGKMMSAYANDFGILGKFIQLNRFADNWLTVYKDASVGSELVSNGGFTGGSSGWTLTTGMTYSSNYIGHFNNGNGYANQTTPYLNISTGKLYRISYYVGTGYGNDALNVSMCGVSITRDTITSTFGYSAGNYTYYVKCENTAPLQLWWTGTSGSTGNFIDTVSVRQITDGDLAVADEFYVQGNSTFSGNMTSSLIHNNILLSNNASISNLTVTEMYAGKTNFTNNVVIEGNLSVRRPYGMYSSTLTQTIGTANSPYNMTFNWTEDAWLINKAGDNYTFTFTQTGDYLVELSIMGESSTASKHLEVWVEKNGWYLNRTNTRYEFKGVSAEAVLAVPFIIDMNLSDRMVIKYAGDSTAISLPYYQNTSYSPETPSAIMTITKISELTP